MNINRLALLALLGGAIMTFGCSSDPSSDTGAGGSAGPACVQGDTMCANGDIDPTDENCVPALPTPPTADVCTGDESLQNPTSCTATGNAVTIPLTQLEIFGDCNVGYNLDGCDGESCALGGLAPGEGINGVDNALAGLAPVLSTVGNLNGVNQAFYDGVCEGDIAIALRIDANAEESCATLEVLDDTSTGDPIAMNLSAAGCVSGTIGTIPLNVAGIPGSMGNAVVRATLSEAGLSNGMLGATVPEETAKSIADALVEGGAAVVGQVLDINDDLSGDATASCNALSITLTVGGVNDDGGAGGGGGAGGADGQGGAGGATE